MKKILLTTLFFATGIAVSWSQESADKITKLNEAIDAYVNQYKFNGTILIASHGKVILQKGYGFKDASRQVANNVNTVYEIASLAKAFTAAVILRLQEMGKLSVQDPLSKYLPGYPNGDKITIHHLLSHTSGVVDYTSIKEFRESDQSKPVPLDSMIAFFRNKPLDFAPGSKFSYSNSGYTLLGAIIEKITGKPYHESLEKMILKPLQLRNSGYDFIALKDTNKATGYTAYAPGNFQPAKYVDPSILYTTGALYSTVHDLYAWHKVLLNDQFLSAASRAQLFMPVISPYAYGWISDSLFGKKRISHDGNVPGFKSNINRIPEDDVCIIALSNSNSSQVGGMVRVLMSILYDQPYKLPEEKKFIQLPADVLKSFAGIYEFSPQVSATVTLENEHLFMQGTGLAKFELLADSALSFFGRSFDAKVEFVKDETGHSVDGINFYVGKQKFTGKKVK